MYIDTVKTQDELREIMSKKLDMSDELINVYLYRKFKNITAIGYCFKKREMDREISRFYSFLCHKYEISIMDSTDNCRFFIIDLTSLKPQ
jgi:hypothetical protein